VTSAEVFIDANELDAIYRTGAESVPQRDTETDDMTTATMEQQMRQMQQKMMRE